MTGSVVLTGASSFVGEHLALAFKAAGWDVTATHSLPLAAYDGCRGDRLRALGEAGIGLHEADVSDPDAVRRLVDAAAPRLWVQHAGYATGYASPAYDLAAAHRVNVLALDAIYQALAGTGAGVIVTGSSMEYAASSTANREEDACWPDTPYGLSKLAETLRARQLAEHHGVPTRVARLYIPFGPHDNPRKLIPSVLARLRAGQPIALSAGTQRRDFIAVGDVCRGYLSLAQALASPPLFDVFNLCSGEAVAVRNLLVLMAAKLGADPALLRFGELPMRAGEAPSSFGDAGKAMRLLAWSPSPLDQSIAWLCRLPDALDAK